MTAMFLAALYAFGVFFILGAVLLWALAEWSRRENEEFERMMSAMAAIDDYQASPNEIIDIDMQYECPGCGPAWHGAFNTDLRCVTCGLTVKLVEGDDE